MADPQPDDHNPAAPYSYEHSPGQRVESETNGLSTAAAILAGISLFILPPVFGIAAIVCAGVALGKRETWAALAMSFAVVALIAGMAIGYYVGYHRAVGY